MKIFRYLILILLAFAVPAFATVTVTSPKPGATVTSPVQYTATSTTSTCSKGVASMGVYVDNKLIYVVDKTSLNTQLSLNAGAEHTVVQEWDHCGGSTYTTVNITVQAPATPTVSIAANPTSITSGSSSTLTVNATNATQVTVTGTDGSSHTLSSTGGTLSVSPAATTTYTATAAGSGGKTATSAATVTVTPVASPSVSIAANPTSITSGSSSTLTVTAMNATQVTVSGTDGSSYTLASSGGTLSVSPTTTTTYTATATGSGGKTSTSAATVTVTPAATPTVNIVANPTSITSGSSSTLTVTATNATQVTVTGSDGSSHTLSASGGTLSVSPTATTTYTATATGTGGKTATSAATVTVVPAAPAVNIAANPASIAPGSSSTLTVTATNATQVTVTGTDGSTYTLQPNGGTISVTPSATTTYTATATGSGGKTATSAVTVTVTTNPAPTVSVTANPNSVTAGSSSILTVMAMNATKVTLTGTDGSSYTLSPTGGTQAVSPASSTTYTATATGAGGTTTATATLTVTPNPPPTVMFSANPASITEGNSSTLTVGTTNATQVTIAGTDGSSYTLATPNGTQSVSPTTTTTYTATATGAGGTITASTTVTVVPNPVPTVSMTANPTSIISGNSSTLTVTATNANQVTITGTDGSTYTLQGSGGTQSVSPTSTTTYTATATGDGGNASTATSVTVTPAGSIQSISHIIFLLQENHTFDNYFGMLNPYRVANGWNKGDDGNVYTVDGIDDKLTTISNTDDEGTVYKLFKFKTTCIDDDSTAWLASYGDVNRYDFLATRPILMDGFVHTGEGFAKNCASSGSCSGSYTDLTGQRAMGYYDQGFLNYYYYMASQFAVSDRWFSPASSKSVTNRIATFTGGTTQGLVNDPGSDDHLGTLNITTIFQELDQAKVSWKIYYTETDGYCLAGGNCSGGGKADYPATYFTYLAYAYQYLHSNTTGTCTAPTVESSAVGDTTNSFCIDPAHIAPLTQYYTDLTNGTLPSFAFIEAGSGLDEHPGSGTSVLKGQAQMAKVINAFMASPEWKDSVFFFSYDEGGGPYDHVPPVPGHSNDYTDASLGTIPDISSIAVNADSYKPCVPSGGTATLHCDLTSTDPGANSKDAPAEQGFAAQLGFRLPNMIISPFTRRHYVSHIPMDHTAVIKFVENRFIGSSAHLNAHDAAQPDLLDFFDFNGVPWATPPSPPTPNGTTSACTPASMGP